MEDYQAAAIIAAIFASRPDCQMGTPALIADAISMLREATCQIQVSNAAIQATKKPAKK